MADRFVRVRLPRIDQLDLRLFEFDYDLTMMIFFLDADEKVYARYGGRDGNSADSRQSLDGLLYTMKSVLRMHERADRVFAPQSPSAPKTLSEFSSGRRGGRCMHCHEIKEALHSSLRRKGEWSNDLVWRYPLPDNLGLELEVDRGNVVKAVRDKSPAATLGLKPGDVIDRMGAIPVHSFADAQLALDRAPKTGAIDVTWRRGDRAEQGKLPLFEGWRKTDLGWRPSVALLMASAPLAGTDLSAEEKKSLGLPANRLAFRQRDPVASRAREAGIRAGDIILGVDERTGETDVNAFRDAIKHHYLMGDRITVHLLRDGKRLSVPVTLGR